MAYNTGDIITLEYVSPGIWEEYVLPNSSAIVKGITAYASATDVRSGIEASKAITPASLADSHLTRDILHYDDSAALTVADGLVYWRIPLSRDGWNLKGVEAALLTPNTHAVEIVTLQIARGRLPDPTTAHAWQDVLSTKLTIDKNEYDSRDSTVAFVFDALYTALLSGDLLRLDCDVIGTGATGLMVNITLGKI